MTLDLGPYGAYVTPASGVCDATGQLEILALLDAFMATMPTIVGGSDSSESSGLSPDFMEVTRHYKEKLQVEIDAIKVLIDAMAVA